MERWVQVVKQKWKYWGRKGFSDREKETKRKWFSKLRFGCKIPARRRWQQCNPSESRSPDPAAFQQRPRPTRKGYSRSLCIALPQERLFLPRPGRERRPRALVLTCACGGDWARSRARSGTCRLPSASAILLAWRGRAGKPPRRPKAGEGTLQRANKTRECVCVNLLPQISKAALSFLGEANLPFANIFRLDGGI